MAGKWHLEIDYNSKEWVYRHYPNIDLNTYKPDDIPLDIREKYFPNNRGYTDTYFGYRNRYWTTVDNQGNNKKPSYLKNNTYRLDVVSNVAVNFIEETS